MFVRELRLMKWIFKTRGPSDTAVKYIAVMAPEES